MAVTRSTGKWTYQDILQLPDDGRRYEKIDGELYEMPSPTSDHAIAVMNAIALLLPVVTALRGRLFTAPLDVFLEGADPVQPDVMVLLPGHLDHISMRGIEGRPALVVEVLNPSNAERDRVTKRALYARGGVREYWLVSPEAATVEVFVLEDGAYVTHVRAAGDEPVTSVVLPGLTFAASEVFSTTDQQA